MTTHLTARTGKRTLATVAILVATSTGLAACGSGSTAAHPAANAAHSSTQTTASTAAMSTAHMQADADHALKPSEVALSKAMRGLWGQHLEWTYATIAAFASGAPGFQATLNRLLQNQTDIGNAIKPYYGETAGDELTKLLKQHSLDYVPVLKAAKAGNSAAANKAFAKVLANGVQIGKFLEGANPKNWPAPSMENMMTTHNKQTLDYASLQLQGKYAPSITEYGKAEAHMRQMSDMLTAGIIAQFPNKFH